MQIGIDRKVAARCLHLNAGVNRRLGCRRPRRDGRLGRASSGVASSAACVLLRVSAAVRGRRLLTVSKLLVGVATSNSGETSGRERCQDEGVTVHGCSRSKRESK